MKRASSSVDGSEADFEVFERRVPPTSSFDPSLMEFNFPQELEEAFAAAIFELGLRYSSPKVIVPLLPNESAVNKEHIKSHLQKYRIHHPRSREEFLIYYNSNFKDNFSAWVAKKGWIHSAPRDSINNFNANSEEENNRNVETEGNNIKNVNVIQHSNVEDEELRLGNSSSNCNFDDVAPAQNLIHSAISTGKCSSAQQKLDQQADTEQLIVQAENIIVNWKNLFSQSFSQLETSISNLKSFLSQMDNSEVS